MTGQCLGTFFLLKKFWSFASCFMRKWNLFWIWKCWFQK